MFKVGDIVKIKGSENELKYIISGYNSRKDYYYIYALFDTYMEDIHFNTVGDEYGEYDLYHLSYPLSFFEETFELVEKEEVEIEIVKF